MITFILANLICPTPDIQNTTKYDWTKMDTLVKERAEYYCKSKNECLKLFRKVDFQVYVAVCGVP